MRAQSLFDLNISFYECILYGDSITCGSLLCSVLGELLGYRRFTAYGQEGQGYLRAETLHQQRIEALFTDYCADRKHMEFHQPQRTTSELAYSNKMVCVLSMLY